MVTFAHALTGFLAFRGPSCVNPRLDDGIGSAQEVARANPDEWNVEGAGWITGSFTDATAPPIATDQSATIASTSMSKPGNGVSIVVRAGSGEVNILR